KNPRAGPTLEPVGCSPAAQRNKPTAGPSRTIPRDPERNGGPARLRSLHPPEPDEDTTRRGNDRDPPHVPRNRIGGHDAGGARGERLRIRGLDVLDLAIRNRSRSLGWIGG